MNTIIQTVTQPIIERSKITREIYLRKIEQTSSKRTARSHLPCSNLAHGFSSCCAKDKNDIKNILKSNIAIVSSYNNVLSAHKPYECYPKQIRKILHDAGAIGQLASGCDR